jgi:hypothetical protein
MNSRLLSGPEYGRCGTLFMAGRTPRCGHPVSESKSVQLFSWGDEERECTHWLSDDEIKNRQKVSREGKIGFSIPGDNWIKCQVPGCDATAAFYERKLCTTHGTEHF